ncbi:leucine-rich repeat domain-containing protein [Algoriphagus sp.]|uniref:leucine-rich repeat domain-containing protein n=1 Tax=Algoriphagus sp. TaxID=1872435 RepID=UPI0026288B2D|nr:leucine-rich repeat domain-containing protein [Algoriphagus sp.]
MIKNKFFFLAFILLGLGGNSSFAQTIKGYSDEEIADFSSKVEDQIRFLEYLFNTIGASDTPARDKDVIIRESYLKIFRDAEVQVEDDLLFDRKVVTNKNVTAYLKDIEFFFEEARFEYKIREVKPAQKDNGDIYFLVSLDRTIESVGKDGKKLTNTKPRFVEVNLNDSSQELKIVSIYTTKLSRDEELLEWWEILGPHWKAYFQERFELNPMDSIDLDLLYKFVSLDSLDISGTDSLLDLSPLEALRDLKYVDLSRTNITELGPISNVTFLEYLDVSHTPTQDIQFIKYSDRLKHLNISHTQIEDISDLENLKKLETLQGEKTPILNFVVLNEFESLKKLNLSESGFNNAENIQKLTQLEELDLSRNYIVNFDHLASLQSLKKLNLSETNIQDLSPLANLNQLEELDLTRTEISDISVLNSKNSLVKVLADETRLSVYAADEFSRTNPKVLLIHHVKDLESWWSGLSEEWKAALKKANPAIVSNTPNVEILTETIGLESLDLSNSGITNLTPLTRFVKLERLNFSNNPVSDLLPLSEVKTLVEINGNKTQVRDLNPIRGNDSLRELHMSNSPVESILPVIDLPNLTYLNVNGANFFEDEVPDLLIKKPELTLVYRVEELETWWEEISSDWKELLRRQFSLTENPSTEQLHNLTAKSELNFERVNVEDLSPITAFVNLRKLSIFDSPIYNIGAISEMVHLSELRLAQAPITDFLPLSALFNLERLDISNTGLEDLTALSNLVELKYLNISGTNLRVLRGLETLTFLEELDVASTNLRSLRPIEGLDNLKKLTCFNTRLSSRAVDRFREINPECQVRFY